MRAGLHQFLESTALLSRCPPFIEEGGGAEEPGKFFRICYEYFPELWEAV